MRRPVAAAAAFLALALLVAAGPAVACPVCIALPESTIADRLIEAEAVALAREDPARPFAYLPTATLKGAAPGPPVPFLVDSPTRRRLDADADAAVIVVLESGGWAKLAYAERKAQVVMEAILAAAPDWELDADDAERFAFFAALHDHPDTTVRELALAEISRAPYVRIRTMTPRLARAEIVRVLRDPRWTEWAPIHILFLGLSDDPADHALVRRALDTIAAHGVSTHLAAWATALAEIDGPSAILRLRTLYFEDRDRDVAEQRAVATAFATLAQGGDPKLRQEIDAAFRGLASASPALAAEAASLLAWREDWSQAATFADLLASGAIIDPAAEFAVSAYVSAAGEALDALNQESSR